MFLSIITKPAAPQYCYHQYLWTYFDKEKGDQRPFIYRVLGESIIMLSRDKPACRHVNIADRVKAGQTYQFDVLCSPVRGTYRGENRERKRREPYRGNADRLQWLGRRFGGCADVRFAQVFDRPVRRFKKGDGHNVTIDECVIRGTVYVKDKAQFIETMLNGIGGRGAWGHGLLMLPDVMI